MRVVEQSRDLKCYLDLDYPITIYRAEEGGYVAEVEDLPGCITEGDTWEEVSERIEDARKSWIETAYEDGVEIPLPRNDEQYSGKFIVRIPKSLHRRLAEQARREGVSLNQYVESILSESASSPRICNMYVAQFKKMCGQSHLGEPLCNSMFRELTNVQWPQMGSSVIKIGWKEDKEQVVL